MQLSPKVELGHPDLLRWARESAGYTVPAVAKALGRKEEGILDWEEGRDQPRYKTLQRLARKYRRPVAAFFLPDVPTELPSPNDFRTTPGRGPDEYEPESLLAFREARNWLAETRDLVDLLAIDLTFSLPAFTLRDPAEQVASEVRNLLGPSVDEQLGWPQRPHAVSNTWRDILFDRGILSVVFKMPFFDVRAFSVEGQRLACIGLNSEDRGYGRIFSLFHEVGHLCLRQPGVSGRPGPAQHGPRASMSQSVEHYCDRFAASLLMPADDPRVQDALATIGQDPTPDRIAAVARRFKVSKYVALRRAWELGRISRDLHWALYRAWQESDAAPVPSGEGGPSPAIKRVSWLGRSLTSLVFEALDSRQITSYRTSKLLGLGSRHLSEARALAVPELRDAG